MIKNIILVFLTLCAILSFVFLQMKQAELEAAMINVAMFSQQLREAELLAQKNAEVAQMAQIEAERSAEEAKKQSAICNDIAEQLKACQNQ